MEAVSSAVFFCFVLGFFASEQKELMVADLKPTMQMKGNLVRKVREVLVWLMFKRKSN